MLRIVKKYPNRRLYDTELSKYITLANIKEMVIENIEFCVKDMRTDEDVTRNILLQIIANQEQKQEQEPFFSTSSLSQIIRFYEDSMQSIAGNFVQQSLDLFVKQQLEMQKTITRNPIETMSKFVANNLKPWRNMRLNFFKTTVQANNKKKDNH